MASGSLLPASRQPNPRARPMSMFEVPSHHMRKLQNLGEGDEIDVDSLLPATSGSSKQAKRRSLLPTFSRKQSPDNIKESVAMIREDTSDSEVNTRAGAMDERKAMPPPPQPARPASMRLPGSVPARTSSTHTRASSKESAGKGGRSSHASTPSSGGTVKADSGIKRTGSTKLPQSPRTGGPMAPPAQHAIPTRGSSTRATASTTAQKRSSIVAKPTQGDRPASRSTQPLPAPASPPGSTSQRPSTRLSQMPPPSRPAFSTYQQHYSPSKSALPKPGLPTTKPTRSAAPPSVEPDVPMTLDIALEQIELLQLSLLHEDAERVMQAFEDSAKSKLSKRHARLRKQYEDIRTHEQQHRRAVNLHALESWCPDAALMAEHLQTLSRTVTDLRAYTDAGTRYSITVDTFDDWATKAEGMLLNDQHPATFIEALPESWRAIHTSLALKLRSIQRDISVLPPPPPRQGADMPSSLEIILGNCSALVDSMLKELDTMTKLQKEVLQRGKARIDEQINALMAANQQAQGEGKENWVPAWQSVS